MTVFVTADAHFGHENIIKYSSRPFSNVDEMDKTIISNWNSVVSKDDIVYHVGDFCMGDKMSDAMSYISCLSGNIILIKGSHDRYITQPYMMVISKLLQDEYGNDRTIVLNHYAMRSWPLSHYASWHLFGHHHGKLEPYGLSFDVGMDCWDFIPVSLDQIARKMSMLKPIVDFRKKE